MAPQAAFPGADIAHARAVLRRPFVQAEEGTHVLRIAHRIPALGAVLTGAVAALLAAALPAHADGADAAADCPAAPSKPFTAWGDNANYVPVPGGSFESGDETWSVSGGAAIETGNGSVLVRPCDKRSLTLPAGGSATSPKMSIGLAYPTLRFFALNNAPADGRLTVQVLFRTPDNAARQLKIADLSAGQEWQPTRTILILANLLALYPTWDGKVAFSFTASGATWNIDDVSVDPYER
jgi:hypothetical protein